MFAAPLCTDDGVVVAAFFGVFVTFLVYLLLGASEPAELWSGIGVIGAGVAGSSTTQSVEPAARAPTLSFTVAGALLVASLSAASPTWLLFALVNVFCVAFAPLPLLVGSIAADVPYEEQGRIQGAVYSLSTGATVIGSIAFLQVYDAANGSTVIAIIAGLFGICALVCSFTRDRSPDDGPVLGANQARAES